MTPNTRTASPPPKKKKKKQTKKNSPIDCDAVQLANAQCHMVILIQIDFVDAQQGLIQQSWSQ